MPQINGNEVGPIGFGMMGELRPRSLARLRMTTEN